MCGIAGSLTPGVRADRSTLERMVASLRHRGPDGMGVEIAGPVGLGHARLSIIDVAGGAQPMSTEDGAVTITFNGEIFNYVELREALEGRGHRFRTRSDTEVILRAYLEEGEACVERFNGQWAFAIWDAREQKLFLSRDRMGVRPLYYTSAGEDFFFASEIKALLECPGVDFSLDPPALDEIFTFWVTVPPRTIARGIRQLPPGHSMAVESGRIRTWPHWRLEYAPETDCGGEGGGRLAADLLDLLLDAVRIRLRADVPVGAYLSGGLDSTLVAALARQVAGDRLRTFSVQFADAEFDESRYQELATGLLETRHSAVRCTGSDIARVFPEVIRHVEQPVLRTAPAPMFLLAELVRDSGFKVVLTGEGADETMGGYDIFKEAKIRRFWGRRPESAWRPLLLKRLYPYMADIQKQPPAYLQQFFRVTADAMHSPFFSHLPRWELTSRLKMFFSSDLRAEVGSHDARGEAARALPGGFSSWNWFSQAECLEATGLLPGYILSAQGDRVAMAHSVEARYPFLDHRVVEFAAKLPPRLKMKVLDEKHLLKEAAAGLIPEEIRRRHKQPYRAPDGACFAGDVEYVRDLLSAERIRRDGVFDPRRVEALQAKFAGGHGTSTRDNMALTGVLSTQILLDCFSRREAPAAVLGDYA